MINTHHRFRETMWYSQTRVRSATVETRGGGVGFWVHLFPALTLGKAEETMGHGGSKCKVSEEYGLTLGVL